MAAVEKNNGQYRATHHAFKFNFVKETKITPHKIPETMYNFAMFDDIVNGFVGIDYLIDVIGEIVEIGHESIISCTLWEALTMELYRHAAGSVVLLLSMAKIKEARGTYPIAIQNSMYGFQIFVNIDMKEILEF
ncbi:hypothetical protein GmHk_01G001830 [Glycine max]|nr:hypothetical protein GmHk_01G001830 [Glycine max]